jgi:hypothetical protein
MLDHSEQEQEGRFDSPRICLSSLFKVIIRVYALSAFFHTVVQF